MTKDLEAINILSDRWDEEVDNVPTAAELGLTTNRIAGQKKMIPSELKEEGENILRMYEAESQKVPDDDDVKASMGNHLYRLGFMYYGLIVFYGGMVKQGTSSAEAQKACDFLKRGVEIAADPRSADLLANIFQRVDFYATAIHWYEEAEKIAQLHPNLQDSADDARTSRLKLQASGQTSDPPLSEAFPTATTPGLMLEFQPRDPVNASQPPSSIPPSSATSAATQSSGAAKGGCMSVLVFMFVFVPALMAILTR